MLSLYHTFNGPPNLGFIKHLRKPVEHLLKAVDGVTLKDVTTVAEKIISSPLTMASHGNGEFISKWLTCTKCNINCSFLIPSLALCSSEYANLRVGQWQVQLEMSTWAFLFLCLDKFSPYFPHLGHYSRSKFHQKNKEPHTILFVKSLLTLQLLVPLHFFLWKHSSTWVGGYCWW